MVLEFHITGAAVYYYWYWQVYYIIWTGRINGLDVSNNCYWLDIPADVFLIIVEVHRGVGSYLLQKRSYYLLLLGWKDNFATSACKVLVASELHNKSCHELFILLREHLLLESGESAGVSHGIRAAVVGTSIVLGALVRTDKAQKLFLLYQIVKCNVVQARGSHGAVVM